MTSMGKKCVVSKKVIVPEDAHTPVTKSLHTSVEMSKTFAIYIRATDVVCTAPEGILLYAEQDITGNGCWVPIGCPVAAVDVTEDGYYGIQMSEGVEYEAAHLPTTNSVRISACTAAGCSMCVTEVIVQTTEH